jgi:hypothetical protein
MLTRQVSRVPERCTEVGPRRRGPTAGAILRACAVGLSCLLALSGCARDAASKGVGQSRSLVSHGVRLDLPAGWNGRTESVGRQGHLAYLQAANIPLHRRPPPERLERKAIVVTLSEAASASGVFGHPAHRLGHSEPVALRPRDLLSSSSPRRPAGRARAVFAFEKEKRYFTLEADLGRRHAGRTLRRVNSVLRTLRIERR